MIPQHHEILDRHADWLGSFGFKGMVVDEAHFIKNKTSQRSRHVLELSERIKALEEEFGVSATAVAAAAPAAGGGAADDGGQAARITVQEFFLRYKNLAGMSGTATGSAGELRRIYRLRTRPVPTNRPPIRRQQPAQATQ